MKGIDFALKLNGRIDSLARAYAGMGRLRIPDALAADAARALHDELAGSGLWCRTFRRGESERELSPDQLAALAPKHLAAIEQLAWAGPEDGFRFLHDAIRIPPNEDERAARGLLFDQLFESLHQPGQIAILRAITGDPSISRLSVDATRYCPGHFLTRHNDGRKRGQRVVAFVLSLSPRWHADWGGLLQFHDDNGDIGSALTPAFNTLQLFAVPQWHSVSIVAPFAPIPRISLAGWLYRD